MVNKFEEYLNSPHIILHEEYAYGDAGNAAKRVHLDELNLDDQKKYIKKLWLENPEKYYEFKDECIYLGRFPNLFGTCDNPIPIDESKL